MELTCNRREVLTKVVADLHFVLENEQEIGQFEHIVRTLELQMCKKYHDVEELEKDNPFLLKFIKSLWGILYKNKE